MYELAEVQAILKYKSKWSVYRLCREGLLGHVEVTPRHYLVPEPELERYLEARSRGIVVQKTRTKKPA